eukprot:6185636-Pleurochrysis_carterae.AAC.2
MPRQQGLEDEIGHVLRALHEGDGDVEKLDALAREEVPAIDVLRSRVMFRIVGQVYGGHVVHRKGRRLRAAQAELRN